MADSVNQVSPLFFSLPKIIPCVPTFSDFTENFPTLPKIFRVYRKYSDFTENIPTLPKIFRVYRKYSDFFIDFIDFYRFYRQKNYVVFCADFYRVHTDFTDRKP